MHYAIEFRPSREVAIRLWGLEIRWYAIFILTGAILAFLWARHQIKKDGKDPRMYDTFFILVVPIAIIGARIWYVLGDLEDFAGKDFLYIINPASGGLAIQGGVMAGVIFGIFYFKNRYKDVPLSYHFDTIVPSVLIGQILGRWGNFMNQEVYGACVEQSKLWFIPSFILENVSTACPYGEVSQPLFLYESFLNLLGFILIAIVLRNYWKKNRKPGDLFACYFIWYGLVRAILEPMRESEYIMQFLGMPLSIVTSVLFVLFGIAVMIFTRVNPKTKHITFENLYVNDYGRQLEKEKQERRKKLIEDKRKELLEKRKMSNS